MDERTVSMCRVPKQPILQETGNAQAGVCNASRAKSETDTDDRGGQVPKHVRATAASEEVTQADD